MGDQENDYLLLVRGNLRQLVTSLCGGYNIGAGFIHRIWLKHKQFVAEKLNHYKLCENLAAQNKCAKHNLLCIGIVFLKILLMQRLLFKECMMTFFDLPGMVGVLPVDGDVLQLPVDDGQSIGTANDYPNGPPKPTK